MPCHTLTESAQLAGVSRRTIQRYVKSGRLSATKDRNGNPTVETSELIRVFGQLTKVVTAGNKKMSHDVTEQSETFLKEAIKSAQQPLFDEIKMLREELQDLKNRIEHKPEVPAQPNNKQHSFSSLINKLKSKM